MTRNIISIDDRGSVSVPNDKIAMRDFEIAELFGVMVPTVKGKITQILKEGICRGDFSTGGIVLGNSVLPEYYDLDMVVAVAFRVQSQEAKQFRRWVVKRLATSPQAALPMFIELPISPQLN